MNVDEMYRIEYQNTLRALENKVDNKLSSVAEIKNELMALYNYEGLGWSGRGMIKDAEISAAIAAYEAFLGSGIGNE
jgi:hypothetical protein